MPSRQPDADHVLGEARFAEVDAPFLMNLRGWLEEPLDGFATRVVRDTAVVLGELMTNAFRHAGPPFVARLALPEPGHAVRVEVHDGLVSPASGWPLKRGLLVVRDLCSDWGVEHRPDGKVTWAHIPVPRMPDRE